MELRQRLAMLAVACAASLPAVRVARAEEPAAAEPLVTESPAAESPAAPREVTVDFEIAPPDVEVRGADVDAEGGLAVEPPTEGQTPDVLPAPTPSVEESVDVEFSPPADVTPTPPRVEEHPIGDRAQRALQRRVEIQRHQAHDQAAEAHRQAAEARHHADEARRQAHAAAQRARAQAHRSVQHDANRAQQERLEIERRRIQEEQRRLQDRQRELQAELRRAQQEIARAQARAHAQYHPAPPPPPARPAPPPFGGTFHPGHNPPQPGMPPGVPNSPYEQDLLRAHGFLPGGDQGWEAAPYLGISMAPAPDALRKHLGLPAGIGIAVHSVEKGSPAESAGVRQNDILHKLNDQLLVNGEQLAVLVRTFKPGEQVRLSLFRGGNATEVTAKLGERKMPPLAQMPGMGQPGMAPHGMPGGMAPAQPAQPNFRYVLPPTRKTPPSPANPPQNSLRLWVDPRPMQPPQPVQPAQPPGAQNPRPMPRLDFVPAPTPAPQPPPPPAPGPVILFPAEAETASAEPAPAVAPVGP